MVACNGSVAIAYNGEMYNVRKVRASLISRGHQFISSCDTEVMLRGWIEWGAGVLDRVEGMYAFVVWDDQKRELFAAVDHVGIKPLYWKYESGCLMLASDADAIRALTGGVELIDPIAFRQVLTLGCCPAPRTMWAKISKLEPGRVLRWRQGKKPWVVRHWSPPEEIDPQASVRGPDFDHLFEHVVAEHMCADVPVGALLSGGIDSAAIVNAAVESGAHPQCFTLSMDGVDDESADAGRVARRLGLAHTVAPAGHSVVEDLDGYRLAYDEPQGYSALLNAVRISKMARRHVKAVITGDGGDEAFGGYLWQREAGPDAWQHLPVRRDLFGESQELAKRVGCVDAGDEIRNRARVLFGCRSFVHAYVSRVFPGFHPAEAMALTESMGSEFGDEEMVGWLEDEDRPQLPHIRRVQRLDLLGFCAASVLPKVDRAAMHFGLETRSPLLDRRLLKIGMAAPLADAEDESTGSLSRPELRRYVSDRLGPSYSARPKQGFSLRIDSEFKQWMDLCETVDRGCLVRSGLLRSDWRGFVSTGDTPRLRLLVMLSMWGQDRF